MTRADSETPWQTLQNDEVYDNPWISVSHRAVITPAGTDGIYGVVHFKNLAVGVLAIDRDEQLVLVGQYRYALQQFSWEIPEGGCPLAVTETAIECAARELAEETGLVAANLQPFLQLALSNSVTDERAEIFLATDLSPVPDGEAYAVDDSEADIQIRRVALQQALQMIDSGEISDAISVAAIYKWQAQKAVLTAG